MATGQPRAECAPRRPSPPPSHSTPTSRGRSATRPGGPRPGATAKPPDPSVTGSTLTETTTSAKTGGPAQAGFNPGNAPLDRVRVDSGGQALTTNFAQPIADNQNSLKAGLRGPALLEDFILREKITHFDHERIPERIVHARGSAAHGFFECYELAREVHARLVPVREGQAHARSSCASRRWRASAARPTRRATSAASPRSSTPTRATSTSSATTSRCSSSRTRSSSPTSSTR